MYHVMRCFNGSKSYMLVKDGAYFWTSNKSDATSMSEWSAWNWVTRLRSSNPLPSVITYSVAAA